MPSPTDTPLVKNAIDPLLISLLRCPACAARPALQISHGADALFCAACERTYLVKNGVPYLLVGEGNENQKAKTA